MKYCHQCKTEWEGRGQPVMRATCAKCSADLHVCLNCRFYDPHKSNQCMANVEDPVLRKERANFCDEFQFCDRSPSDEKPGAGEAEKAKERWNKLFKK